MGDANLSQMSIPKVIINDIITKVYYEVKPVQPDSIIVIEIVNESYSRGSIIRASAHV